MATQADLDAALADFISAVKAEFVAQTTVIDNAVQTIINNIASSGTPIDTSAEVATVTQAKTDFITALDAIAGQLPTTATPPTVPPTPPPTTTPTP